MDRRASGALATLERCLLAGDLEGAAEWVGTCPGFGVAAALDRLAAGLARQAAAQRRAGEVRQATRLGRRRRALVIFKAHGLDVGLLLPPVRLAPGYEGKIILAVVSGGAAGGRICLRGGDDWHREILADLRDEVSDAGLSRAQVDPVGGARVRRKGMDGLVVCGGSEEFGACDRGHAADMLRAAFPDLKVCVSG